MSRPRKNAMSARTIELFRQYTEPKQRPEHEGHKAQAPRGQPQEPNLIVEMARIEHEVRQLFDDASPDERDNIVRYLEVLIRNLKRQTVSA
jgi:hypothetical protein